MFDQFLATLTPEQRAQLATALETPPAVAQPPALPPAAPTSARRAPAKLDYSDAIAVTFTATLAPSPKARDPRWAQTYNALWVKGHANVRGPKGGLYCLGTCVLRGPDGAKTKGTFKIADKNFRLLQQGQPIDAWFIDETDENVLLGTISGYTVQT